MKRTSIYLGLAILLILIVGAVILARPNSTANNALVPSPTDEVSVAPSPSPSNSPSPTPVENEDMMSPSPSIEDTINFRVEGEPYSFSPDIIRVKQGDRVRIEFISTQGLHDFVLDEFDVRTEQLSEGETETIEFVADTQGTYEFYCSVGNHRQLGMVGTFIVE